MTARPVLFLDVDGVLNRMRVPARQWWSLFRSGYRVRLVWIHGTVWPVWLNPEHGRLLRELASRWDLELVWVTRWRGRANSHVARRLGLPALPVVAYDHDAMAWKWRAVIRHARGRPLAWLDDELDAKPGRPEFLMRRGQLPTLLHRVDPAIGLTAKDLHAVEQWLRGR